VQEQLTKEAKEDWEQWTSLQAPQSDSAEEYCDPAGPTPLIIPLEEFLPQSPHFDRRCHGAEASIASGRPSREVVELQRYRAGDVCLQCLQSQILYIFSGQCVLWAQQTVGEAPRVPLDIDPEAAARVFAHHLSSNI